MSEPYLRLRRTYQDISGELLVTASTDDTTLVTVRSSRHTIFVQKIHIRLTGSSGGKTWIVEDSSDVSLTGTLPTDSAPVQFDVDFGPRGKALTEGTSLRLDVSAAGAAGIITWEGYQKSTTPLSLNQS